MRNTIKVILVDDEHDSLNTIAQQLKLYCPDVEILGIYDDAEVGRNKILELRPDVAFLDIKMPKLSGLDLAQQISPHGIQVVFITAYEKYAINAIKLSALDYLLKPLQDPDELKNVVSKVKNLQLQNKQIPVFGQLLQNEEEGSYSQDTEIALADEKGVYFYKVKEIIRLKADKNCCMFYFTEGRKTLVTKNLGTFSKLLEKYDLVQVNRSEVINLEHRKTLIKSESYLVMSDGSKVTISGKYKDNLPYYKKSSGNIINRLFGRSGLGM